MKELWIQKIQVRQNFSVTQIMLALLATRSGPLYSKGCQKILSIKDFLLDFKKNVGTSFLDFEFIFSNNVSLLIGGFKVILASEDNSYGLLLVGSCNCATIMTIAHFHLFHLLWHEIASHVIRCLSPP